MRNKKKMLAAVLAGSMAISCLAGCGAAEKESAGTAAASATKAETAATAAAEGGNAAVEGEKTGPITTDPITISVLTKRHKDTNKAEDIWFFQYLEYWLGEQGYDVTFDLTQGIDVNEQLSIMFGTDSLPDLVWGATLDNTKAVTYGEVEGMLLDWSPYINAETMPNLYALIQEEPDALTASTCNNGAVYSLPYFTGRDYNDAKLSFSMNNRVYVDTTWMEECGVEKMPETIDEFLDMLRAFKNKKLESGAEVIPVVSNANFFEKMLWAQLGHYGNEGSAYGTTFTIKDGQVVYPAYTEDYRTFVEIMNTCYEEGLISKDFFTMDKTTARGLMTEGVCGVACDWTLGSVKDFQNMVALNLFPVDDNEVVMSLDSVYRTGTLWANANTEYPEVLALIADYLYSEEGAVLYKYGPMQGQDPLNMLDGWYYDENGVITTKMVADGTVESMGTYVQTYVYPYMYVGTDRGIDETAKKMAGIDSTFKEHTITDVITGKQVTGVVTKEYDYSTPDGHWRKIATEAQEDNLTVLRLPGVYMTEDIALRSTELGKVIKDYVSAETAKFITGSRPLSEIDAFHEELRKLEIEEYIGYNVEAYSAYMEANY